MMNAHFWHAVLSVPDDEEAERMMDMLELYERQQWELEKEAVRRRVEAEIERMRHTGQATLP